MSSPLALWQENCIKIHQLWTTGRFVSMETSVHQPEELGHTTLVDDERKQIQEKLAQFILSLIQAFLRTGYYTPDHPESKKAKAGLYEDFRTLFIQKDELTFLVRDDPGRKNILIGALSW